MKDVTTTIPTAESLRKPVEIKYRVGKKGHCLIHTVLAVASKGGRYYQGVSTVYLTLADGSNIEVDESKLLKGHRERCSMLYGRAYLLSFFDSDTITLEQWNDWEDAISGTPNDTETVWQIGYKDWAADHTWLIECKDRILFHTMNNPEIEVQGKFRDALKKLFKGKKIRIETYECIKHVEEL